MGQNWRNWRNEENTVTWQNNARVIWNKHTRLPNDKRYLNPKHRRRRFIGLSSKKQPQRGVVILPTVIGKRRIKLNCNYSLI